MKEGKENISLVLKPLKLGNGRNTKNKASIFSNQKQQRE